MRLVSYDDGRVGCLAGDQVFPLPGGTMRDVIAAWDGGKLAIPCSQGGIPLAEVRLRVPVADPSKITVKVNAKAVKANTGVRRPRRFSRTRIHRVAE